MKSYKNVTFWLGLILFITATTISYFELLKTMNNSLKVVIYVGVLLMFIINESFKAIEISEKTKKKIIGVILKRCDELKYINPEQRLRSNIFKRGKKQHKIIFHYNMDAFDDKNISILVNMGVTGDVFRTGTSKFATRDRFSSEASFKIADEELKKVPKDLEWIYAVPIAKDTQVYYVLCIDGNRVCTDQTDKISAVAAAIANDIKDILI